MIDWTTYIVAEEVDYAMETETVAMEAFAERSVTYETIVDNGLGGRLLQYHPMEQDTLVCT